MPNHCYNVSLLCSSLLKLFGSNKPKTVQKNVIKFNLGKITSQTLRLISVPTNDFSPTQQCSASQHKVHQTSAHESDNYAVGKHI